MTIRKSDTIQNIPHVCGVCKHCKPYKVDLPKFLGGAVGLRIGTGGGYVWRYYCGFDHQSARDSTNIPTGVHPAYPPPRRPDGGPFCPIEMGYYDAESVSVSGKGITIVSMKGSGLSEEAERPARMSREEKIAAALAMLREEGVEIREEAPEHPPQEMLEKSPESSST